MTSALIEIRLSDETEESTSPERQEDQDTRYCDPRGWDVVHIARCTQAPSRRARGHGAGLPGQGSGCQAVA
jgi:hypothetical protein